MVVVANELDVIVDVVDAEGTDIDEVDVDVDGAVMVVGTNATVVTVRRTVVGGAARFAVVVVEPTRRTVVVVVDTVDEVGGIDVVVGWCRPNIRLDNRSAKTIESPHPVLQRVEGMMPDDRCSVASARSAAMYTSARPVSTLQEACSLRWWQWLRRRCEKRLEWCCPGCRER